MSKQFAKNNEKNERKHIGKLNRISILPMEAFHEYPPFDDDSSARKPLAQPMTPP